jgi:hypothetical protein
MIHTMLNPTHIAHSARCVLVAGTLATALIGNGLQSPGAAHAASIRPATTSAVRLFVHGLTTIHWRAYRPGPLDDNRGTFIMRPLTISWY